MIDTEVYMSQPPSYIDQAHPSYVCKLIKSLYGLKQAGRIWHSVARLAIVKLGLKVTFADSCVFVGKWESGVIIIGIHVDDFILAGTASSIIHFKEGMMSQFQIKMLGKVKFILGIQIKIEKMTISLSQKAYICQFIKELRTETIYGLDAKLTNMHPLSPSLSLLLL
jgi:hypothetical protein